MSIRGEWEFGDIKIPRPQFLELRDRFVTVSEQHADEIATKLNEFWKSLSETERSTADAYVAAAERFCYPEFVDPVNDVVALDRSVHPFSSQSPDHPAGLPLADEMFDILFSVRRSNNGRPRKPRRSDISVRTQNRFDFHLGRDAEVFLNRRESRVVWYVPEASHSVERAYKHPLADAVFDTLNQVEWNENCGGAIIGTGSSSTAGSGSARIEQIAVFGTVDTDSDRVLYPEAFAPSRQRHLMFDHRRMFHPTKHAGTQEQS